MNQESLNALDDLRVTTNNYLTSQKLSASRIVNVVRNTRPARLLSFDYYGTSSRAQDLIDINNRPDVSYFSGNLKVLTDDDS